MPGPNQKQQAPYISTGNWKTADDPSPYAPGMVGTKTQIVDSDGKEKTIQYVQFDSTMTVTPYEGAVMWWSDKAAFKVTSAATNRGRVAGVAGGAITKGNYGFIAKKGEVTVKFIDAVTANPTAAGLHVIPSATAAKADCLAAGSAATYPLMGVSASAYDAPNTTATVDLDIPEVTG